jgi:hypothetical protein
MKHHAKHYIHCLIPSQQPVGPCYFPVLMLSLYRGRNQGSGGWTSCVKAAWPGLTLGFVTSGLIVEFVESYFLDINGVLCVFVSLNEHKPHFP